MIENQCHYLLIMFPTNSSPLDANNLFKSLIQQECGCVSFCIKYIRRIKENQIIGECSECYCGRSKHYSISCCCCCCFIFNSNECERWADFNRNRMFYSNIILCMLPVRAILYGGKRLPFRAPRAKPAPSATQIAPTTASPMYNGQSEPGIPKQTTKYET